MTPNRGPVTRCTYRGCVVLGHFSAYDGRCPMHRAPEFAPPRKPTLEESWNDQITP